MAIEWHFSFLGRLPESLFLALSVANVWRKNECRKYFLKKVINT